MDAMPPRRRRRKAKAATNALDGQDSEPALPLEPPRKVRKAAKARETDVEFGEEHGLPAASSWTAPQALEEETRELLHRCWSIIEGLGSLGGVGGKAEALVAPKCSAFFPFRCALLPKPCKIPWKILQLTLAEYDAIVEAVMREIPLGDIVQEGTSLLHRQLIMEAAEGIIIGSKTDWKKAA
eukprot:1491292-Prorocentrum_lima.AAC.2